MNDMTNQIDVLAMKIATLNKEQNDIKIRYLQISGDIVHILESIANIVESSYGEFFLPLPEKSADIISMYESKEEPKRRGRPKKAVPLTVEETRQELIKMQKMKRFLKN